jgi:hypothetical protein
MDDLSSNATVVDTLADLYAQYKTVRKLGPKTDDEAKRRSSELIRLGRVIAEAKRQANTASAEQRVAGGGDDAVTAAEVIDAVAESVPPVIQDLRQKVSSLERRMTVREQRRSGTFQGEWAATRSYQVGDYANVGGTMWKCVRANMGMAPGISLAWELWQR